MSKEKQDVFDELISITAACDKVRYGRTLTDSAVMESNLISLKKLLSNTH